MLSIGAFVGSHRHAGCPPSPRDPLKSLLQLWCFLLHKTGLKQSIAARTSGRGAQDPFAVLLGAPLGYKPGSALMVGLMCSEPSVFSPDLSRVLTAPSCCGAKGRSSEWETTGLAASVRCGAALQPLRELSEGQCSHAL